MVIGQIISLKKNYCVKLILWTIKPLGGVTSFEMNHMKGELLYTNLKKKFLLIWLNKKQIVSSLKNEVMYLTNFFPSSTELRYIQSSNFNDITVLSILSDLGLFILSCFQHFFLNMLHHLKTSALLKGFIYIHYLWKYSGYL